MLSPVTHFQLNFPELTSPTTPVSLGRMAALVSTTGVSVQGIITSQAGARQLVGAALYGNAGNDVIALASNYTAGGANNVGFTGVTSTTLGGGAGADSIATMSLTNWVTSTATASTALTIAASMIEGGGDNDTITLLLDSATITGSTVQGSQGDDVIGFVQNGRVNTSYIFAGGGNDSISGTFSAMSGVTFAGGGGVDSISITATGGVAAAAIYLDAANSLSNFDGADQFTGAFSGSASGITLQGGAGNDTVTLLISAGADNNNLYQLQAGDDVFSGETFSASTIQAGAGDDVVTIASGLVSSTLMLGGGTDTFNFLGSGGGNTGGAATGLSASTIYGGAGADLISGTATIATGTTVNAVFGFSAASDSVLSAMDTIGIGGSGTIFTVRYDAGGLTTTAISAAGEFTATNGSVVFTGTFASDVTARVNAIDAQVSNAGTVLSFVDGNNVNYLFVKGSSDDLVAQFGYTGGVASGGTLTVGGAGSQVTLGLAGQR